MAVVAGAPRNGQRVVSSSTMVRACDEMSRALALVSSRPANVRRIVIAALEPFPALDLVALSEVFFSARQESLAAYSIEIVSAGGGLVTTTSGLEVASSYSLATRVDDIDTLIAVSNPPARGAIDTRFGGWLRQAARNARRLVSVGTAAFVLAELGLLDGRRVTTHWSATEEFAVRFPTVALDPGVVFVRHGAVYSCGGAAAAIDLALTLVEEDLGAAAAHAVARRFALFVVRAGDQPQLSTQLSARVPAEGAIRTVQAWIAENLGQDLSVGALARRAAMSPRHFARVFHAEVGATPAAYVQSFRVEVARTALEHGVEPLKAIAQRSGFRSVETMRRAFRRRLGLAPSQYRELTRSEHARSVEAGDEGACRAAKGFE
jgi:transcriptional regulator GlxA family with amidase domain